jgi:hypothetical protein
MPPGHDSALSAELVLAEHFAAMLLLECNILEVDQRHILVTLLFAAPVETDRISDAMRSIVWLIGPDGQSEIWPPGKDYPGSSVWFAEPATGILLGNDFHKPAEIYACQLDGKHVASFAMSLLWDNPIRPWRFRQAENSLEYADAVGNIQIAPNIAALIASAGSPGQAAESTLVADWRPRVLPLPANVSAEGKTLFRISRGNNNLQNHLYFHRLSGTRQI